MRSQLKAALICSLVLLLSACFAPQNALAHAVLEKSVPQADATVNSASLSGDNLPIVLTFNSRIDAPHSSLSLVLPDGKSVPLVIETDPEANILRSRASGLKPGHYSLRWQAVAGDGHVTRGTVPFNVR
jgi:copper resistance protein C